MYAVPNAAPSAHSDTSREYGPWRVSSMVYAGAAYNRMADPSRRWTGMWPRDASSVVL